AKGQAGQLVPMFFTYIMDLMRLLAGDARWCYARVSQDGALVSKGEVKEGAEGAGPIAGNHILAVYGLAKGATGYFGTQQSNPGNARFALQVFGSKGILQLTTGSLPAAFFIDDPSWFTSKSKAPWQEITSAGLGKPEPLKDGGLGLGNIWIAKD